MTVLSAAAHSSKADALVRPPQVSKYESCWDEIMNSEDVAAMNTYNSYASANERFKLPML